MWKGNFDKTNLKKLTKTGQMEYNIKPKDGSSKNEKIYNPLISL